MLARPSIELLESRWVPSASSPASSFSVIEPNETIDQAYDLGGLNQPADVVGSVGNGPAGAADVTWYEFELTNASKVDLSLSAPPGTPPFASVLSLFNNDPQDFGDPYDADGHRLLAQVQANPSNGGGLALREPGAGRLLCRYQRRGRPRFLPGDCRQRVRRGDGVL